MLDNKDSNYMPVILELLQNDLSPVLCGWNPSCFPNAFGLGEHDQENVSLIHKRIDSQLGIHRPQKTVGDMLDKPARLSFGCSLDLLLNDI